MVSGGGSSYSLHGGRRYSVGVSSKKQELPHDGVGLCARCRFMRLLHSDRGSTFYLCELSATEPSFPKYPRLPVLRCEGYQPMTLDESAAPK